MEDFVDEVRHLSFIFNWKENHWPILRIMITLVLGIDWLQWESGIRDNSWGLWQWFKWDLRAFIVEEGSEKSLKVESTCWLTDMEWYVRKRGINNDF